MRKTLLATAVTTALAAPMLVLAADPTPEHTFTPNVGVVSDYLFRGVSQTHGKPAIQGGLDYSHSSGLYAGVFASSITWVKDAYGKGGTEIDVYGGYKNTFAGGDWNYDLGVIAYTYPGKGAAIPGVNLNPNTKEVYGALGYKWLTVKYSHVISPGFIGWGGGAGFDQKTQGSGYLELNASYDLGDGWGVSGHLGSQKVKNYANATYATADYTDWNVGVTKDVGFGVVGLIYSAANTKGTCNSAGGTNPYCWANGNFAAGVGSTTGFDDVSKGTAVLTFKKTF